ncbi:hypothetical protein [Paenibacillus tarimensis]|uniref:hypothetical protein n=1 Tax=Paenibacillus tarimensis TaxID=416012 RepID=UPI001F2794E9|nr:hypothetical protein [Paenibacillus tarimensis]MCF2945758.1 hypothetical protein [Paenibacillus tarimensis]
MNPFESFYPGDITNVSSIEILSGDGGERKTINDKSVIKEWLEKIRHVQVVPEPDQEDYTGFLYVFTLYEHGEEMLTFSPLIINGIKVESSDEIVSLMHELYFLESNRAA